MEVGLVLLETGWDESQESQKDGRENEQSELHNRELTRIKIIEKEEVVNLASFKSVQKEWRRMVQKGGMSSCSPSLKSSTTLSSSVLCSRGNAPKKYSPKHSELIIRNE